MVQEKIEEFEQGSPMRKVSMLNRLNLNSLYGPLSEIGITRGTLPFLMEVLCAQGSIQEDISNELAIDKAATARAMRNLEESGFVERRGDPGDRRRKRVYATSKTQSLQKKIMVILKEHKETLFTGFSEEEQLQFLRMLDRMIKNMRDAAVGA